MSEQQGQHMRRDNQRLDRLKVSMVTTEGPLPRPKQRKVPGGVGGVSSPFGNPWL
jgi:hypothetical protein